MAESFASSRSRPIGKILPPDLAWLGQQAPEPILEPALPIIDTHHHLWDRPHNRFLPEDLLAEAEGGHNLVATVTSECDAFYRTEGPEEMRPVGETEFIVSSTNALGNVKTKIGAGISGFANLMLGDRVRPVLEAHVAAGQGRFRGTRFTTTWDASDQIGSRQPPHALANPMLRAGIKCLSDMGLVYDAWVFFHQVPELTEFAASLPDLSIVCCHCGGQLGYGPYKGREADTFQRWKAGMAELAKRPNVTVKLGGLLMRLAAFDYATAPMPPTSAELAALWKPTIETCIELFGPDRCMFESNFPVEKMGTSFNVLWNAFKRITERYSADEKAVLYAGTARRVYRIAA